MTWTAPIACCLCLVSAAPAAAHRLDEYLQASRIAIAPDFVAVEIDLTPGVSVASKVVALIDADRDGVLSSAERQAYALLVVGRAQLTVDGAPARLVLAGSEYPAVNDMCAGVGTIHLSARAAVPPTSAGPHNLDYVNVHQPEMSAYLINALQPGARIRIGDQHRDPWQHELRLDYVVDSRRDRAWRFAAGLGVVALLMCTLGWFRLRPHLQSAAPARAST